MNMFISLSGIATGRRPAAVMEVYIMAFPSMTGPSDAAASGVARMNISDDMSGRSTRFFTPPRSTTDTVTGMYVSSTRPARVSRRSKTLL